MPGFVGAPAEFWTAEGLVDLAGEVALAAALLFALADAGVELGGGPPFPVAVIATWPWGTGA